MAAWRTRTIRMGATGTPSPAASTTTRTWPARPTSTRSRCAPVRSRPHAALEHVRCRRRYADAANAADVIVRSLRAGHPLKHTHAQSTTGVVRLHALAGAAATATPPTFSPPDGTGRVCRVGPAGARVPRLRWLVCMHDPEDLLWHWPAARVHCIAVREPGTQPVPCIEAGPSDPRAQGSPHRAVQHSR